MMFKENLQLHSYTRISGYNPFIQYLAGNSFHYDIDLPLHAIINQCYGLGLDM